MRVLFGYQHFAQQDEVLFLQSRAHAGAQEYLQCDRLISGLHTFAK